MLIINADDLGRTQCANQNIFDCFDIETVSSSSLMVFASETISAANRAKALKIRPGLHLNFTEPFAPGSPQRVNELQSKTRRFLLLSKYSVVLYHPLLTPAFRELIALQLKEFRRLFDQEPDHINGHQHLHLATNILIHRLLPKGIPVRRSFSFSPSERNTINRLYRRTIDRSIKINHPTTDYFYSITNNNHLLKDIAHQSLSSNVELMVHPERVEDMEFLNTADARRIIKSAPKGNFGALNRSN